MNLDKFEEFLSQGNMAKNTISAYLNAVKEFCSRHKEKLVGLQDLPDRDLQAKDSKPPYSGNEQVSCVCG